VGAACPGKESRSSARESPGVQDTVFAGTTAPLLRLRPPPRAGAAPPAALLRSVTAAPGRGYDRVVFELAGDSAPGYRVEYVAGPVRSCGSGDVVSVAGSERLVGHLEPARAHDDQGSPVPPPPVSRPSPFDSACRAAGAEFHVPAELLEGVGWAETRWQMVQGTEEFPGRAPAFGVMALRGAALERGAALAGVPVEAARRD